MILDAKVPFNANHRPRENQKRRTQAYELVTSTTFEISIIIIIFLNMMLMAFSYEGSTSGFNRFTEIANYIFTLVFIFEAALKIYVFRFAYFVPGWNKFDFFVVISSVLDILISNYPQENDESSESGRS